MSMKYAILLLMATSVLPIRGAGAQTAVSTQDTQTYSLQEIISIALERNPFIAEGQGILEEKEGSARSATAYPNPTVSVQSGRGSIRDPSANTSITERYVTLSQPLEWPGTRHARQQATRAGVEGARAELDEVRLNVIAQIKKRFFELLLAEREAKLSQDNLQTVNQLSKAVQVRVKAGEAPPFESIKMKVERLKTQKELTRANGTVQIAKAALNGLTAGAMGENFNIQGEFQSSSGHIDQASLLKQALATHPIMLKGQKRVEEAKERHRRERQARIPNLTLSGSYQRDIGREAFVGGLSVPLPLWSQRQGEIAQAKGVMRQEEAMLLRARTNLQKNITQQVQSSQVATAQIATYEDGLFKQAKEALRIAQVRFRYGEASLLEVLDAQRVVRETEIEYARAKYDLSVALTELEQLTGNARDIRK